MPRLRPEEGVVYLVRCNRCQEVIKFRVNLTHDLVAKIYRRGEEGPAFVSTKHVMGNGCFQVIKVQLQFSRARIQTNATIEGGAFTDSDHPPEEI